MTYAAGFTRTTKPTAGWRPVESVAVRLQHRDGRRAWAVWETTAAGKWSYAVGWLWRDRTLTRTGADALKAEVSRDGG